MGRNRSNYELKARFHVEADSRGVEELEARLRKLDRQLKAMDGDTVDQRIGDGDDTRNRRDNINDMARGFRNANKEAKNLAASVQRVRALGNQIIQARVSFKSNEEDVEKTFRNVELRANALASRTFELILEAKLRGDKEAERQLRTTYAKMQREAAKALEIRMELQGDRVVQERVSSLARQIRDMTNRPYEFELTGDMSDAARTFRTAATRARDLASRAWVMQIKAEERGMDNVARKARLLRAQMLQLANERARMAVQLDGVPRVLQQFMVVKRAGEGVEGRYEMRVELTGANAARAGLAALNAGFSRLNGSSQRAGGGLSFFGRTVFAVQRIMYGFMIAIVAVGVAAAGPLVAGLTIAAGTLGILAGGLGLLAAAAAPVISALSNQKQTTDQLKTANEQAKQASQSYADAQRQLAQALTNVSRTQIQNQDAIRQSVNAHADAVRGVQDARRAYQSALRGQQEAERSGEDRIRSAIEAHRQAVLAVQDARRALGDAVRAAEENIRSAVMRHTDALRAQRDAVRNVIQAREDLERATQDVARAQRDLVEAQRDEIDNLRRLGFDVAGSKLDQQQAILDTKRAQIELNEALAGGNAAEIEQARINLERARLREQELALDVKDATEQLNDARKKGTENLQGAQDNYTNALEAQKAASEQLREAERQRAAAGRDVAEAARDIVKAQEDGARSIAAAQRALAEAQRQERLAYREIGKARADARRESEEAARAVAEAHRNIADAIRNENEAEQNIARTRQQAAWAMEDALMAVEDAERGVARALEQVAKAQSEINKLMDKLPPDVKALGEHAKNVWTRWKELTADARTQLIGLGHEILYDANRALPLLATAANQTAARMVLAYRRIKMAWADNGVFKSLQQILSRMPQITQNWTEAIGFFLGGLINVMAQALPWIERFSFYIRQVGLRFLRWTDSDEGRSRIAKFFESARIVLSRIGFWVWKIGSDILNWSIDHPHAVANAVDFLGGMLWAAWRIIRFVLNLLFWFRDKAPAWLQKTVVALGGVYIATRLIPRPLRSIAWWIVRLGAPLLWKGVMGAARGARTAMSRIWNSGAVTRFFNWARIKLFQILNFAQRHVGPGLRALFSSARMLGAVVFLAWYVINAMGKALTFVRGDWWSTTLGIAKMWLDGQMTMGDVVVNTARLYLSGLYYIWIGAANEIAKGLVSIVGGAIGLIAKYVLGGNQTLVDRISKDVKTRIADLDKTFKEQYDSIRGKSNIAAAQVGQDWRNAGNRSANGVRQFEQRGSMYMSKFANKSGMSLNEFQQSVNQEMGLGKKQGLGHLRGLNQGGGQNMAELKGKIFGNTNAARKGSNKNLGNMSGQGQGHTRSMRQNMGRIMEELRAAIQQLSNLMREQMTRNMQTMRGNAVGEIGGMRSDGTNELSGWSGVMHAIGTEVGNSIANGLRAARQAVIDAAKYLASLVPEWAKKALNMSSPSKVMVAVGENAGGSMGLGIEHMASRVRNAVGMLAGQALTQDPTTQLMQRWAQAAQYLEHVITRAARRMIDALRAVSEANSQTSRTPARAMLAPALGMNDSNRMSTVNRATSQAMTARTVSATTLQAPAGMGGGRVTGDAMYVGRKIDSMKEEIIASVQENMQEIEISNLRDMYEAGFKTALDAMASRMGRNVIDDVVGSDMEFDRIVKGGRP